MKIDEVVKIDSLRFVRQFWEKKPLQEWHDAPGKSKRKKGVYVLFSGASVYYVGRSVSSLRGRLREHASRDRHVGNWDAFSFYEIEDVEHIAAVEALLIRVCRPAGNRRIEAFLKSVDLGQKRPNKAPEPTPTAVTPRAIDMKFETKLSNPQSSEARVAPAAGVAHL